MNPEYAALLKAARDASEAAAAAYDAYLVAKAAAVAAAAAADKRYDELYANCDAEQDAYDRRARR